MNENGGVKSFENSTTKAMRILAKNGQSEPFRTLQINQWLSLIKGGSLEEKKAESHLEK